MPLFVVTTERDPKVRSAADLVDRNFCADAPNIPWVADITYVPTWAGFLYLAVTLDAFSHGVIGWAMDTRQTTLLVPGAMNMAVTRRKPSSVIHHSDQGTQYTSVAIGLRCKEMGSARRWGRSATVFFDAICESFFAPPKSICSTAASSRPRPRRGALTSRSLKDGTTPRANIGLFGCKSPIHYERTAAVGLETTNL